MGYRRSDSLETLLEDLGQRFTLDSRQSSANTRPRLTTNLAILRVFTCLLASYCGFVVLKVRFGPPAPSSTP